MVVWVIVFCKFGWYIDNGEKVGLGGGILRENMRK